MCGGSRGSARSARRRNVRAAQLLDRHSGATAPVLIVGQLPGNPEHDGQKQDVQWFHSIPSQYLANRSRQQALMVPVPGKGAGDEGGHSAGRGKCGKGQKQTPGP